MTRDEILLLLRDDGPIITANAIMAEFASIRAAEREACAKIAEKAANDLVSTVGLHQEASSRCYNIASRIRARAADGRGE